MKPDPEPYTSALGHVATFLAQASKSETWPRAWNFTPKPPSDEDIRLIHLLIQEAKTRTRWTRV